MLSNDFQALDELRPLAEKCPRCSLCKFPPLVRVEDAASSGVCPSYEEFKVHASSGGGLLVMALSLLDGRSEVTETFRRLVYGCHACGACDVSCKFSSDIEVQETLLHLRARVLSERGPLPGHAAVLDAIARFGHPLPAKPTPLGEALTALDLPRRRGAPVLVWVGPHFALDPDRHATLRRSIALLERGGLRVTTLGADEPYVGRAALEIGDRHLFRRLAIDAARAIDASGAERVVCLSAEDYATLRADVPRVASLRTRVEHVVEAYDALLAAGRLVAGRRVERSVTWHDSSYLGRLSEPYLAWRGVVRKVSGQIEVHDPPRPVRRGGGGCYEPPRRVLARIPGLRLVEMPRRREYAFDSGESGQVEAALPDFASATASRRVAEAERTGADLLATECPQGHRVLTTAAADRGGRITVTSLTDLLGESVEGVAS
jgi:Fe-S oxidoreductase